MEAVFLPGEIEDRSEEERVDVVDGVAGLRVGGVADLGALPGIVGLEAGVEERDVALDGVEDLA